MVALRFEPNNGQVQKELRRIEKLCDAPNENELVMEVANKDNNSVESSSKEDGQVVSHLIDLYALSANETVSKKSARLEPGNPIEKTDQILDFDCPNMLLDNVSCVEDISPS